MTIASTRFGSSSRKLPEPVEVGPRPWKPKSYQKRAVRFLIENGAAGLFQDPGLGKTSETLAAFLLLQERRLVRAMLVIAPIQATYMSWPEEIEKWTDFNGLRYVILHGSKKEAALRTPADVYLINPEGLPWLFRALQIAFPKRGQRDWPFDVLVVDESTLFKNSNTVRFRTLRPWLKRFARRYILTGTPAPNGLLDLFGQIYLLDQGHALGAYVSHYRMQYFDQGGYGGYEWAPRPDSEAKIYERIRPLVLRMAAEDYLELPSLVYVNKFVELPPKARKAYDEVEKEFFTKLDRGEVTAVNAGAASSKCSQMANGGVYIDVDVTEEKRRFRHLHEEKTELLIDLMEELSGQPALIAYDFRHDLDRIRKGLKKAGFGDVPYIGGGVSMADRMKAKKRWDAGQLPALLGNPQSLAHSVNLQYGGRAVIWHSLTWNLEDYMQYIRRVWRRGQTQRVFVYHLIARNTIDEAKMGALASKGRTQRALLAALQGYRRKRLSYSRD